jgi:hypothetical protein
MVVKPEDSAVLRVSAVDHHPPAGEPAIFDVVEVDRHFLGVGRHGDQHACGDQSSMHEALKLTKRTHPATED